MYLLIFNIWILLISITESQKSLSMCYFGTSKKYLGRFDFIIGKPSISHFNSFKTNNKNICNKKCQFNDSCYATSFDENHFCSFYNTSDFKVDRQYNIQTSQWIRCNTSNGYQPDDNRCSGLFITHSDKFAKVEKYKPLNTHVPYTDILKCRNKCLKNPLCGFVNRFNGQCILVAKWPYQNINITEKSNWEMDKWVCIDNFTDKFQIKKNIEKPIDEKCTGYWEITNRNTTLTRNESKGLSFQTQIYENCLEECNQYPNCTTAWYNFTYSLCILKDIEISEVHLLFNDTIFINFEWKCVKNDSHEPPLNSDERKYLNLGMNCYKIVNDTNIFIGKDKCGRCPHESEFHQCLEYPHELWDIRDSCLKDQSYWGFPPSNVSMNITGRLIGNMIEVFTGLQLYWIAFPNDHIKKVDYLECRHFNASRPVTKLQFKDIISKKDWQSELPRGDLNLFRNTPINILITASQLPLHSCKTKAACTDILRTLQINYFYGSGITQNYSDIPYNFMIDDSGHIYECRGVKHQCAAIYPHNFNTICLGYIGWYAKKLPNEAYLSGIKKLIDYLENNQYLVKDYAVYVHQDLTAVHIKRNLKIVIKNFYRYKGFIPDDCRNISLSTIYSNLLIFIIIIPIMFVFYRLLHFNRVCSKCKFLSENNCYIHKIFPFESDLNMNNRNFERFILIYERLSITRSSFHSKVIKLIKLWFFNRFLEAMNARCTGNTLQNYLSTHLPTETPICVYQIDFNEKCVLIVLSNINKFLLLNNLIKNGSCVCFYFVVESNHFSELPLNIEIAN